jgi:Fe2+ or Zn2+ uptake regulation protein
MIWIESEKKNYVTKREFCDAILMNQNTFQFYTKRGVITTKFIEHKNEHLIDPIAVLKNLFDHSDNYSIEEIKKKLEFKKIDLNKYHIYKVLGFITEETISKRVIPKAKTTEKIEIEQVKEEIIDIEPEKIIEIEKEFANISSSKQADTVKQVYLAKNAKLKFLVSLGKLIPKKGVENAWISVAMEVKKAMMAIPSRVSEICAVHSDGKVINQLLTNEIGIALRNLQFNIQKLITELKLTELNEDEFN